MTDRKTKQGMVSRLEEDTCTDERMSDVIRLIGYQCGYDVSVSVRYLLAHLALIHVPRTLIVVAARQEEGK